MTAKGSGTRGKAALSLNADVYPLDVVLSTCYVFLDRAYFHLDGDPKKRMRVDVQLKEGGGDGGLRRLVGEFRNELLNQCLRTRIARENRKIREYVVSQALMAASPQAPGTEPKSDEELDKILAESEPVEGKSYLDDPLGIAIPWEEKYGKDEQAAQEKPISAETPAAAESRAIEEAPAPVEGPCPDETPAVASDHGVQPGNLSAPEPPRDGQKV